jgi:hypothetical protein
LPVALINLAWFTCGTSRAALITGNGLLGHFEANVTYSAANSTSATLTVELFNTSPAANGGYLTAFIFNNPGNFISDVSLSTTDSDFSLLGGPSFDNSIGGSPFGLFDIGVSTGGGFEGGGPPSNGIGVGNSATFTFSLTGANLDTLTVASFLNELSAPPGDGKGYQAFVARFRGFNDGGSDKVPGHAPEPTALMLGGLGVLGLLGYGWRRRTDRG